MKHSHLSCDCYFQRCRKRSDNINMIEIIIFPITYNHMCIIHYTILRNKLHLNSEITKL